MTFQTNRRTSVQRVTVSLKRRLGLPRFHEQSAPISLGPTVGCAFVLIPSVRKTVALGVADPSKFVGLWSSKQQQSQMMCGLIVPFGVAPEFIVGFGPLRWDKDTPKPAPTSLRQTTANHPVRPLIDLMGPGRQRQSRRRSGHKPVANGHCLN